MKPFSFLADNFSCYRLMHDPFGFGPQNCHMYCYTKSAAEQSCYPNFWILIISVHVLAISEALLTRLNQNVNGNSPRLKNRKFEDVKINQYGNRSFESAVEQLKQSPKRYHRYEHKRFEHGRRSRSWVIREFMKAKPWNNEKFKRRTFRKPYSNNNIELESALASSTASHQFLTGPSSDEGSAGHLSVVSSMTGQQCISQSDEPLLVSAVDTEITYPEVLFSDCYNSSTEYLHIPGKSTVIISDDKIELDATAHSRLLDSTRHYEFLMPKSQARDAIVRSILCSDSMNTLAKECSMKKASSSSTSHVSPQMLFNFNGCFEHTNKCIVAAFRIQPGLSTLPPERRNLNRSQAAPDSKTSATAIHELFHAARSTAENQRSLAMPLSLLSHHTGLRWDEKDKVLRCHDSGCGFECHFLKGHDLSIQQLQETIENPNLASFPLTSAQDRLLYDQDVIKLLSISACRTNTSRKFYHCDFKTTEPLFNQPAPNEVTDLIQNAKRRFGDSSDSSANRNYSASTVEEARPLNLRFDPRSVGFIRNPATAIITHDQVASAKMLYFQPGNMPSLSVQRGQIAGRLRFEDAYSKMQVVQFVRDERQVKQGSKRDQEAYKMRDTYIRYQSFAKHVLWRKKRPLELALYLAKNGLYLSVDELPSVEESTVLKGRCSFCKRSFDIVWGMHTELYSVLTTIRTLHERRGPTCPKNLGLRADDIPLTANQQKEIMKEIGADPYYRKLLKQSMKVPTVIEETTASCTESSVTDQMESDLFAVPDYFSSDENARIIQPDDLIYLHSWPQDELCSKSNDGTILYSPTYEEEVKNYKREEVEVINLDPIESSVYEFAKESLQNSTKTMDSGFSRTMKNDKFEEHLIIKFVKTDIQTLINCQAPLFPSMILVETRLNTFKSSLEGISSCLLPVFMLWLKCKRENHDETSDLVEKRTRNTVQKNKNRQILWNIRLACELLLRKTQVNDLRVPSALAKLLAEAGFFLMPHKDSFVCVCFWCGVALKKWTNADPFLEHARNSCKCGFVLLSRGKQFVVETLQYYPPYNAQTERVELSEVLPPCMYDPPELIKDKKLRLQQALERACDLPKYSEANYNYVLHFTQSTGQTFRFENREIRPRIETPSVLSLTAIVNVSVDLLTFATENRLKTTNADFIGVAGLLQCIWDIQTRMKIVDIPQVSEFVAVFAASEESAAEIDKYPGFAAHAASSAPRTQTDKHAAYGQKPKKREAPDVPSGRCNICTQNPANILLRPCNHVPLCDSCAQNKKNLRICIKCDHKVLSWMKIYL